MSGGVLRPPRRHPVLFVELNKGGEDASHGNSLEFANQLSTPKWVATNLSAYIIYICRVRVSAAIVYPPKLSNVGNSMDLTEIFSQPVLRRCWLLNKALENASFDEALKLAQVADEFLCADKLEASASIPTKPVVRSSQGPHYASLLESALSLPLERESNHHLHPTDIVRDAAETIVVERRPSLEGPLEEPSNNPGGNREIASQVAVEDSLLVLANQEEIVRYLRQRNDVVVPDGANVFLVNGRFRLNIYEMLARANKMRERQGKPLFQPMPAN